MLFLSHVVTFLGQLHFTRIYFFIVNTSAEQLLLQSNQFDTTVLLLDNTQFFRTANFSEQILLGRQIYSEYDICRRVSFSKQTLLHNIKFFRITAFSTKSLPQKRHFFRAAIFPEVLSTFKRSTTEQLFFFIKSNRTRGVA